MARRESRADHGPNGIDDTLDEAKAPFQRGVGGDPG
jgi:hypothetical protein